MVFKFSNVTRQLVKGAEFPSSEFYNLTRTEGHPSRLCSFADIGCCSCEPDCMKFRMCCINNLWHGKEEETLNDYLKRFLEETSSYKTTTCRPILKDHLGSLNYKTYYMMVSSCPKNSTFQVIQYCENANHTTFDFVVPVFDGEYLYSNTYCAICNGATDFSMVNISLKCESKTVEEKREGDNVAAINLDEYKVCSYAIAPSETMPISSVKQCYPNAYGDRDKYCSSKSQYYQLCNSYYGTINILTNYYPNYHCFLCSEDSKRISSKELLKSACSNVNVRRGITSWSVIISFTENSNTIIREEPFSSHELRLCKNNKIYNIVTKLCEDFSCANGYQKERLTCQPVEVSINKVVPGVADFKKCLLRNGATVVMHTSKDGEYLENIFGIEMELFHTKERFYRSKTYIKHQSYKKIEVLLENKNSSIWDNIGFVIITSDKPFITELYDFDISRTFPGGKYCYSPVETDIGAGIFTKQCNYHNKDEQVSWRNISQSLKFSKKATEKHLFRCQGYHLYSRCPLQPITDGYTFHENKTITVTIAATNKTYFPTNYVPLEKGIGVCFSTALTRPTYAWRRPFLKAEHYISIVGTSLSIICYIVIIFRHAALKKLKHLAGLIVVGLCVALLFSDSIFLIASRIDKNPACKIFAIILHWGLLISEMWLLVMAFELVVRFGLSKQHVIQKSRKSFMKYCVFTLTIPSIIILVTNLLNEYDVYNIGYGDSDFCIITEFLPRIYFYILPVIFVFASAIVAFIWTVAVIAKKEQESRNILQHSGRQKISIAKLVFKLVLTLAVIEIVGIVQINGERLSESKVIFNSIFSMLFTILRSLRGVILFSIYGFNMQTFKLIKIHMNTQKENGLPPKYVERSPGITRSNIALTDLS